MDSLAHRKIITVLLTLAVLVITSIGNRAEAGIIFGTAQLDLYKPERLFVAIDVSTGKVKKIGTESFDLRMRGLTFSPDGTLYGLHRATGDIVALSTDLLYRIAYPDLRK